jgi:hypothetical protein
MSRAIILTSLMIFACFAAVRAQSVAVQYTTTQDFGSGFTGEIRISNTGTQAINGWTLAFDLDRNINSIWNASIVSHSNSRYTVTNAGFNSTIPAGGYVTFGFNGSPGGMTAATAPSNFSFNGMPIGNQPPVSSVTASTFTYQGRLTDGSATANGVYDFEFALYDEAGVQIGTTVLRQDAIVTNGIFTVQIDFGTNAFSGANRFLEIRVRPGNSNGGFTTLAPRQAVTAAPRAIYSLNAAQLGGVTANQYVLTTDPRLTTTINVSGNGTLGGNLIVNGTVSSGCRSEFTAFANGRLCVSAMQPAATFRNAVTACKNISARVGNSADVMLTLGQPAFNYFGGYSSGWLADHIGDDTWGTWNVSSPDPNFDGAPLVVTSANPPSLPFRCVY